MPIYPTFTVSTAAPLTQVKSILTAAGFTFEVKPLSNGKQIRCHGGQIISVFRTGKILVQGIRIDDVVAALAASSATLQVPAKPLSAVAKPMDMPPPTLPARWTNRAVSDSPPW